MPVPFHDLQGGAWLWAGWGLVLLVGLALVLRARSQPSLWLMAGLAVWQAVGLWFLGAAGPALALGATGLLLAAAVGGNEEEPATLGTRRLLKSGMAIGAGAGLAALSHALLQLSDAPTDISAFYLAKSAVQTGISDPVGAVLLDFRGMDNVLVIAALALAWLVVANPQRERAEPGLAIGLGGASVILSIWIAGHWLPGSGFAGGMMAALALWAFPALASGPVAPIRPSSLIGVGLALALAAGLASWLFARPFLTSAFGAILLPFAGRSLWGSASITDLAGFLAALGLGLAMLPGCRKEARE